MRFQVPCRSALRPLLLFPAEAEYLRSRDGYDELLLLFHAGQRSRHIRNCKNLGADTAHFWCCREIVNLQSRKIIIILSQCVAVISLNRSGRGMRRVTTG